MKRKDQRSMLMLAIIMAFVLGVFWAGPVGAGDLEPPAGAVDVSGDPVSTMCTLQEICDKLDSMDEKLVGAAVEKTGQTDSYATGDDGDLEKGVARPNPRFTDNEDGTVTDNLTGLIWLKDANCIATYDATSSGSEFDNDGTVGDGRVTWEHALDFVAGMNDGIYADCNAGQTDWRLPNVKELQSLIDYGNCSPCLPTGHLFSGVVLDYYWSSTTNANNMYYAWYVFLNVGHVRNDHKVDYHAYVWPVRGGE